MIERAVHPGVYLTNRFLELTVLPTERCNFRCTYCPEGFIHGRMKPDVVEGIKRLLSTRAPGLTQLHVSWFGGEPLLARKVIRDVMAHVRLLQGTHRRLRCTSDMTTNAWLLNRSVLEEMVDLGVGAYQITFDGPKKWHDRRRLRVNGEGTFERIWSNLKSIKDSGRQFSIQARIHVDARNRNDIPGFINQIQADFAGDRRFQLFIRPVSRLGGAEDIDVGYLTSTDDAELLESLRGHAHSCGFQQYTPQNMPVACYAARANSYIIRADGRVGKCTTALEHPANQVGHLDSDGKLTLDTGRMLSWMRGVASGDEDALDCPLNGFPDQPLDDTETQSRSVEFMEGLGQRLTELKRQQAE